MSLTDSLMKNGIVVTVYKVQGIELRHRWEQEFAQDINRSVKKSIYFNEFLWHVFSYGKLPCLTNDKAISAFENEKKQDCYVFYQNDDVVYQLENAEGLRAEDFSKEDDVYIVDTGFNWTYVQTHESDCGPYFYKSTLRR
ncbi:DUF4275 family protein [Alicyclobacillus sp. SP_1]|uniref:DUF4275 family protein n=1 Tax=Alicyclobacillus sp. SP_1 TaxID=2942475 RepID=UPI002157CA0D|nr:DUF4275 family protein [Alicyclobacillus sp. SP_1]